MRVRHLAALSATAALLVAAAPLPSISLTEAPVADAVTSTATRLLPSAPGVLAGDLGPAPAGEAIEAAAQVLAAHADALGVDAGAFAFDHVRVSDLGTHVRGAEVRDGVAVDGTSAAVHVVDGRVVKVEARGTDLPGTAAGTSIGEAAATTAALTATGVTETVVEPTVQRLLVDDGGVLRDVHRVHVTSLAPPVAAAVDVDTATGAVVDVLDTRQHAADHDHDAERADSEAPVFWPNPVVMGGEVIRQVGHNPLESFVDTDISLEADALLTPMAVRDYDVAKAAAGNLSGPWVDVFAPGSYADGAWPITKSDPRFEGVNVYVAIDTIQRYFRDDLGLTEVNAEPQLAIAFPVYGFDNSFYQPANDLLLFGAGGVDDGEDSDVVIHELGHAIHDDQVPGWGRRPEGGAMGEGFGDLLAGLYFARTHGAEGIHCFADWDGTAIQTDHDPCLRPNDDDSRMWPGDKANQVHQDGEMWSAYITRLAPRLLEGDEWSMISRADALDTMTLDDHVEAADRTLHLLLSSHELLSPTAEFRDAIDALLQAAELTLEDPAEVARYQDMIRRTADETTMPYAGAAHLD